MYAKWILDISVNTRASCYAAFPFIKVTQKDVSFLTTLLSRFLHLDEFVVK